MFTHHSFDIEVPNTEHTVTDHNCHPHCCSHAQLYGGNNYVTGPHWVAARFCRPSCTKTRHIVQTRTGNRSSLQLFVWILNATYECQSDLHAVFNENSIFVGVAFWCRTSWSISKWIKCHVLRVVLENLTSSFTKSGQNAIEFSSLDRHAVVKNSIFAFFLLLLKLLFCVEICS